MNYTASPTLVLIDSGVEESQVLVKSLIDHAEVIVLEPGQDSIAQISQILSNSNAIESLHIISHGQPGQLQLGTTTLNSKTLPDYIGQVQQWKQAFAKNGSILLYGCQVAAHAIGKQFVQTLHELTGLAIAASETLTGCALRGGDWNLEVQIGEIHAALPFQPSALALYPHILPAPNLLYGSGTGTASNILMTINTSDGSATEVGTLLFGTFAIARDAATGRIYYIENQKNGKVAYFDPATGENKLLGNTGVDVTFYKLAQSVSGQMYGMDNTTSKLYTIDQSNGSAKEVGSIKVGAADLKFGSGDIAFDPSNPNRLFVSVPNGSLTVYTVDTDSTSLNYLKATLIQTTGLSTSSIGSLAFGADGNLYAVSNQELYQLDPTGVAVPIKIGTAAGNYSDFASLPVETPTADLQVTVSDGLATATPNSSITYTITVTNASTTDLTSISVSDLVPTEITGVTWTATITGGGSFPTAGDESGSGNPEAKVNLNAGASVTYTVKGTVANSATPGTTLTNTATVSAEGINDPDLSNNSAIDTTTVVKKTGPTITVKSVTTTDRTPQLTGTVSDPEATIQVTVNKQSYTATNKGDGTWTLADNEITTALADGIYDVIATATDTSNNVGSDTTINELVVDQPPVVTVDFLKTSDKTPQLTGTVDDPNAIVTVTIKGKDYIANNNKDGTWTLPDNTIDPALVDGIYPVLASAKDEQGNTSTDSTSDELTIDSTLPQVIVTPIDSVTSEAGGTGTFQVVLNRQPTADVILSFSSSDTTEGQLKVTKAVFTPTNWNTPQLITVSGVDDVALDGTIAYSIKTSVSSTDSRYNGIAVAKVGMTNTDNDKFSPNPSPTPKPPTPNTPPQTKDVNLVFKPGGANNISHLFATDAEGPVASYTIVTLPATGQGILYLGNPSNGTPIRVGQVIAASQIKQLFFQATEGFVKASFTYTATDAAGKTDRTPATVTLSTTDDCGCDCESGLTLEGTPRKNNLLGTANVDRINGRKGNDLLHGWGCDDNVRGGSGKDRIFGDEGNDSLLGGLGADRLRGGNGRDHLQGGRGRDRLRGGKGDDQLQGQRQRDWLWGGQGSDTLWGGLGNDRLKGNADDDRLMGNRGRDRLKGGSGQDWLDGGMSRDRLNGGEGNDTLRGGRGRDLLWGRSGNDVLLGGRGQDALWGYDGDDLLIGGLKRDKLAGGAGNDILIGGRRADRLTGGAGRDQFIYRAISDRGDRITDFGSTDIIDVSQLVQQMAQPQSKAWRNLIDLTQMGAATLVQIDLKQNQRDRSSLFSITLEHTRVNELGQKNFLF